MNVVIGVKVMSVEADADQWLWYWVRCFGFEFDC